MGNNSGKLCIGSKRQQETVEPASKERESHEDQRFAKMMKGLNVTEFTVDKKEKFLEVYDIGQKIGEGSLGEVRVCQHKTTKQTRAVRIVKKALLTETRMARFMTETILLRNLDHPNVLRLNEMYQDKRRFFVVTELCHGGELFDTIESYVNAGRFCTESEAVYILS